MSIFIKKNLKLKIEAYIFELQIIYYNFLKNSETKFFPKFR